MAKRSLSPFTERGIITNPDNFFGREAEIGAVFAALENNQSVVIRGAPKIGKSSLLRQLLFKGIYEKGLNVQYIDFASTDEEFLAGFEKLLLDESKVKDAILLIDHAENMDDAVFKQIKWDFCVLATRSMDLLIDNSQTIILNSFTPEEARAYVLQPIIPPLDHRAFDHISNWVDRDYHPLKVTIAADLLWNNSPSPSYQTVHLVYAQSVNYNFQDNKPKLNTTPKMPKRSWLKRILGIG